MLFHYTTYPSYLSITRDKLILPATAYVPFWEKPIVWFSTEQFFEPTAAKGWKSYHGPTETLALDGLVEHGISPVRIGVNAAVAPYRWGELKSLSGMSSTTACALASRARDQGANPSKWYGTFEAVNAEKWQTIEYYNGRTWEVLPHTLMLEGPVRQTVHASKLPAVGKK
jgi:hypothetical protein